MSAAGTFAGIQPLITGAAVGFVAPRAEIVGELPLVTGAFVQGPHPGVMDGSPPGIVGLFAAIAASAGPFVGELPQITGAFIQAPAPGEMRAELPLITGSVAGAVQPAGTLVGDLFTGITGSASGFAWVTGPAAGEVPYITGAMAGGPLTTGTLVADVPYITGSMHNGQVGPLVAEVPLITGSGSGWVGESAAGIWLHIHTTPSAQLYALDSVRGRLNPYLATHRIDDIKASPLQAQIGRVNESWSVALTGCGSALRARLAQQSLFGVRVQMFDGGAVIQEGVTDGFARKGRAIELTMQADAWTRDLPIRTTADLGTFRDVEPVAWRYGRNVPGVLIPIDNTRTRFVWADHPCVAVRSILTSDGQPGPAFEMRNVPDATGRAICIVITSEAVDDGVELIAIGDGAKDAISGNLIDNPADVVRDICNRAGRPVGRGTLARFRRDCLARNIALSHSIDGGTLQAAIDSICASVYAVFARSHRQMLRLLPITEADATLDARYLLGTTGDADDIATRLLVRYALEEGNKPRRSLEVRAISVEITAGVRQKTITLDWIRDDRSAADVATRRLQDDARPSFKMPYSEQQRAWIPGEVATVTDPDLGLTGAALVESVNGQAPTCRLRLGNAPTVALAALSSAYIPEVLALASTTLTGTTREFTINDSTGSPAVGARCTLDGGATRITDGRGVVSFPASLLQPGAHTITVIHGSAAPYPLSFTI